MKTKLIKFHFIILLILVVNFFVTGIFDFGLNSYAKTILLFFLFSSGFLMFVLNFKRLFKPFTFLKVYSTFYITIPLLVLFVWSINEPWSNSISSNFERTFSKDKLTYKQSGYEIYEKPSVLDILNVGCSGRISNDYYINQNYFIFRTRIGYFNSDTEEAGGKNVLPRISLRLNQKSIKNISLKNDRVYVDFSSGVNRVYKLESNN